MDNDDDALSLPVLGASYPYNNSPLPRLSLHDDPLEDDDDLSLPPLPLMHARGRDGIINNNTSYKPSSSEPLPASNSTTGLSRPLAGLGAQQNQAPPSSPPQPPILRRKRPLAAGVGYHLDPTAAANGNSSDPAVFSSDDDPALDNYAQQGRRRKRRYVGSWFSQLPASSDSALGDDLDILPLPPKRGRQRQQQQQRAPRTLTRQLDSGVWMANTSDCTTDADMGDLSDGCLSELPQPPVSQLVNPSPAAPAALQLRPRMSPAEEQARQLVLNCVDKGQEIIDLTSMELVSISYPTLEPLQYLEPIPIVTAGVPFEARPPSIRLFLSRNSLTRFPGAVLHVEHLTTLSLRNNRLTELPPAISRLRNLQTLNISQNALRHLPGELLELMHHGSALRECEIHPNPLYQPRDYGNINNNNTEPGKGLGGAPEEYERRTFGPPPAYNLSAHPDGWSGLTTALRGRTPVQFSDSSGRVYSSFCFPPALQPSIVRRSASSSASANNSQKFLDQEPFWSIATPQSRQAKNTAAAAAAGGRPTRCPTLEELALRVAVRTPEAASLADMLRQDMVPDHLPRLVERAVLLSDISGSHVGPPHRPAATTGSSSSQAGASSRSGGGGGRYQHPQRCCVCGKATFVPMTEWVEWREVWGTTIKARALPRPRQNSAQPLPTTAVMGGAAGAAGAGAAAAAMPAVPTLIMHLTGGGPGTASMFAGMHWPPGTPPVTPPLQQQQQQQQQPTTSPSQQQQGQGQQQQQQQQQPQPQPQQPQSQDNPVHVFRRLHTIESERWVPFVRRGCSWACIPQKADEPSPPTGEAR